MTSDTYQNGQSIQALYINQQVKARRGYAIDSGGVVSINTGTLGQADTLSVAAADYWFGGTPTSAAGQDVQIDASDPNYPRKDVVYLDAAGNAQVSKGTPNPVPTSQSGASRFQNWRPAPPDLSDTDAVVLAEVWVPADASGITAGDVADRRVFETVDVILASQAITLTGGAAPAADVRLDGVTSDQFQDMTVVVSVDADPAFAADYAFNYDHSRVWDDSAGAVDVDVTANWDVDPGAGNDVSATVYAVHHDL